MIVTGGSAGAVAVAVSAGVRLRLRDAALRRVVVVAAAAGQHERRHDEDGGQGPHGDGRGHSPMENIASRSCLREHLEGDHRLRPRDAGQRAHPGGHHLAQVLVARHVHDGDEVPLAGDRVDASDAVDVGQLLAERRHGGTLGLDEDDRVGHVLCVSPGSRITTWESVELSTSVLKACSSVATGGNVLKWVGITVLGPDELRQPRRRRGGPS